MLIGVLGLVEAASLPARLILTEVIPGVALTQTNGDKVELYNTGPSAVDLTDWVITDIDLDALEASPLDEGTFAPASLSVPPLQPGGFCVITFVDPGGTPGDNNSVTSPSYGLAISIELDPDFNSFNDQVLLLNPLGNLEDSLAWSSTDSWPNSDPLGDLSALTLPSSPGTHVVGPLTGENGWAGTNSISSSPEYQRFAIDFTAHDGETASGNGSIQRINVGSVWMEGDPDGADHFVVTPIGSATLGTHTFDSTDGTLALLTRTANLESYLTNLEFVGTGRPKIAPLEDNDDFVVPPALDRTRFRRVIQLMLAGQYAQAHFIADQLGYEVYQWTDTATSHVFHVLREQANVGEVGFRGQGTFVFDGSTDVNMAIEAPHPLYDSLTEDMGAQIVVQIRPRMYMVAGTHRNNSTTLTPCDGTFSNGDPYRMSDPSHSVVCFFHVAHEEYVRARPNDYTLQLHGFSQTSWGLEPVDVVISEGHAYTPPGGNFSQVLQDRINAQNFMADGNDLTVAAVYSEDVGVLGATNTVEARFSNGVQWALCCDTYATSSSGHFIHMEQDLDVRQEPQHIIDALQATIGLLGVPVGLTYLGTE